MYKSQQLIRILMLMRRWLLWSQADERIRGQVIWRTKYGYSQDVAHALVTAYAEIKAADDHTAGYLRAAGILHPYTLSRMCADQRLRLCYAMATIHIANTTYKDAHWWLDHAIRVALRTGLLDAQIELLDLRASVNRAMGRMEEAADDIIECLDIMAIKQPTSGSEDTERRYKLLSKLAMFQLVAGQLKRMEDTVARARLAPLKDTSRVQTEMANFEWLHALANHYSEKPFEAWKHVLAAAAIYDQQRDSCSKDRLTFLMGDIELGMAEKTMPPDARARLLSDAERHLNVAAQIAINMNDTSGRLLARIAQLRLQRMIDPAFNPAPGLRDVLAQAKRIGDRSLGGQALIALGDEYAVRGKSKLACAYYRQAIDVFKGGQARVYELIARRKLERTEP